MEKQSAEITIAPMGSYYIVTLSALRFKTKKEASFFAHLLNHYLNDLMEMKHVDQLKAHGCEITDLCPNAREDFICQSN